MMGRHALLPVELVVLHDMPNSTATLNGYVRTRRCYQNTSVIAHGLQSASDCKSGSKHNNYAAVRVKDSLGLGSPKLI